MIIAFDAALQVKNAAISGMTTLAVDVPPTIFDEMTRNTSWITEEDAWKPVAASFPPQQGAYAHQIREAVLRRKMDGHKFLLLFAVREERFSLLSLS